MILSNITVPLLGLVDTAVVGHLSDAYYLGGVAVGATMISIIYALAGFLRMSTTGVTAQACGRHDSAAQLTGLFQGAVIAMMIAFPLMLFGPWLVPWLLQFSDSSVHVQFYAEQYFSIRIFSAPAALLNLVLLGWMLGMQNAKGPMWHLIIINSVNIVLDIVFVYLLEWQVAGVAWASLIADYVGVAVGLVLVRQICIQRQLLSAEQALPLWWRWQQLQPLLLINRDIMLRTLCLHSCFAFVTFQGANLGDHVVAANAILMNFLMLLSFAMDGIAYAVEALVGKAYGQRNIAAMRQAIADGQSWGVITALLFTVGFTLFGSELIHLMSDIYLVINTAQVYLPWLILLPFVSLWCYLLDGVFIGLTRAKDMRDTTFLAALLGFVLPWLAIYFLAPVQWHNHGLWLAVNGLLLLRGLLLALRLRRFFHHFMAQLSQ